MRFLLEPCWAHVAAIIAQPQIIMAIAESNTLSFEAAYKGVMKAITVDTAVETTSLELNDLFTSGGMRWHVRNYLVDCMRHGFWRRDGCNRRTFSD